MYAIAKALLTKPKVRIDYRSCNNTGDNFLTCHFFNDPISTWPFRTFNIKRQNIDALFVFLSLRDMQTCRRVCEIDAALHNSYGQHDSVFPLTASPHDVLYCVIAKVDAGGDAWILNKDNGIQMPLLPGTYECRIFLHADEVDVRVVAHRFVVDVTPDYLHWVGEQYKV